nr:plasma membrane fusion protein prm1 [Quercus suber]
MARASTSPLDNFSRSIGQHKPANHIFVFRRSCRCFRSWIDQAELAAVSTTRTACGSSWWINSTKAYLPGRDKEPLRNESTYRNRTKRRISTPFVASVAFTTKFTDNQSPDLVRSYFVSLRSACFIFTKPAFTQTVYCDPGNACVVKSWILFYQLPRYSPAIMTSSAPQHQLSDPLPPSLFAGSRKMQEYDAGLDTASTSSQQAPHLTPYLGLQARLSQTWINRWTVLLLLVLIRTLLAIASLDDNLGSARREALNACTSVENVGSAMASMPHYMSAGVNDLAANGIEKAINGLMEMLILTVTGVEEIFVFYINLLTSTYLCLITFAVGGSLHAVISAAEEIGNLLNSTVKDVGKDLSGATDEFEDAMNGFLSGINKLGNLLTGDDSKPPTIDLTNEINALNGIQLPVDYDADLAKLNSSIPTFAQVHNLTDTALRFPFEEVKKLLNESLPKYTMNGSIFPVPDKDQLTFCSDNEGINDFFDDLIHIERLAKKIFLVVIIIAAVLAMVPMAYRELRRHKLMQDRVHLIQTDAYEPMDAAYLISRPYTSIAGIKLAKPFQSRRHKTLVRWSVAYATTIPALFVLSLAIAGLLACLCQYILLRAIAKEVPALENQVVGFADKVISSLNNASEQWAVGTNAIINDTNTKINDDVFGWVNTSTTAVNNTLNVFVDEMMNALNVTFGGTVLYEPILEVLNCLILLKVQGIEDGLTWVKDHAHVDFPEFANDTFSLGTLAKVSGSETDILNTGANGGAATAIASGVIHVTNALEKAVRQEAIISSCILLVWVTIALIGIGRALFLYFRADDHVNPPEKRQPSSYGQGEHREMDVLPMPGLPSVPTYEQATSTTDPGNHAGNKYNGHSYTLTPNPIPTFHFDPATSPILNTGFSADNEKVGNVGGQHVDAAIRRPTHIRSSSHGDYVVTSPVSPPQPAAFLGVKNALPSSKNPFADPAH